ncbi:MAG: flavodoxin-dependent (E)-4-hydroxy-3-methylbut-2-enyl-diphosphate synthase [Eubacteriales bacterium]
MNRINSRQIHVGNVPVGGSSPITVQSMTNTNTSDIDATVKQITALENAGCDIIRVAVPDKDAAHAISSIKKQISIPLVADIHFDYKIALLSVEAGADKIRINPGNIGGRDRVRAVVSACKERNIPIRIGVNSGSVPKDLLEKYGGASPEALVESALSHIQLLEQEYFQDICISLKASDVPTTIESYRMMSKIRDYPLHVGVTEAGTAFMGTIKSSIGIGTLLSEGIGDTIRVSLTDKPEEEVRVGISILRALGLRKEGIEVVSCPTCGRTRIDLIGLAQRVESAVKDIDKELKIAVMGCAVNGPGEARDADVAVTGGDGVGMLFLRGKPYKKVPYDNLLDELLKLIDDFESNRDR